MVERRVSRAGLTLAEARLAADPALVLSRAAFLVPADRSMLEAVFQAGLKPNEVAAMLDQPPRQVRYRLRVLCRHLMSERFTSALRILMHLRPAGRRIAMMHFLQRRSIRFIARHTGLTMHAVRMHLTQAEGLMNSTIGRPEPNLSCRNEETADDLGELLGVGK